MNQELHLFYDCDEWKSMDSMRLICVCDSEHVEEIYRQIQDEREYTNDEMETYIFHECRNLNEI